MRPNVEEIRELSKQVDAENWEHTELGENEQYITIGYKYENGRHQANWIAEIDSDEKESDEMYAIGEFIVSCAHNISTLLAYIDELENMPLVQTVVKQTEEIMQLKQQIDHLEEVINDRTNDVIHYDAENKKLRGEKEKDYQMNSDMALTLIEKSDEIDRLREALRMISNSSQNSLYKAESLANWARQALEGSK